MPSHDLESDVQQAPQAGRSLLTEPEPAADRPDRIAAGSGLAETARTLGGGVSAATVARKVAAQPGRTLPALQRLVGNRALLRAVALARRGDGPFAVDPDIEARIHRSQGGGHPLDGGVRAQMEGAFGSGASGPDFSGVRVHADGEADSLNRSVNARAFTTGQDIFFRQGAYSPGTSGGRELIAHELTHVVQQNGAQPQAKPAEGQPLTVSQPGDKYEQEADRVAHSIAAHEAAQGPASTGGTRAGDAASVPAANGAVQRAEEEKKDEGMQAKADVGGLQRQGDDEKKDEES